MSAIRRAHNVSSCARINPARVYQIGGQGVNRLSHLGTGDIPRCPGVGTGIDTLVGAGIECWSIAVDAVSREESESMHFLREALRVLRPRYSEVARCKYAYRVYRGI